MQPMLSWAGKQYLYIRKGNKHRGNDESLILLFCRGFLRVFVFITAITKLTRKSVHRTRMPPPNAIQKKGLYVTVTHLINVMHALVKFHEYIPYSLGVMARTRLTIWNLVKGK